MLSVYGTEKGSYEIRSTVFMDTFVFFCRGIAEILDPSAGSGFDLRAAFAAPGTFDGDCSFGDGEGDCKIFD